MTIAEQMKVTCAALAEWERKRGAKVSPAKGAMNLFAMLQSKPGAVRVGVMFRDELKRGEHEEAGMVDRMFWVAVSRGQAMKLQSGEDLVEPAGGGPALLDLAEEVREEIRKIQFEADTTEVSPDYRGMHIFEVEGFLLDAYYIEFSIGTQLPSAEPEGE